MAQTYYPRLRTLIDIGELPSELSFLQGVLTEVLDRTFFKDLQYSKSRKGGRSFYSLSLVRYDGLDFKIPGTDIVVALSGDLDSSVMTIPVTLSYEWGILDLVDGFSLQSFLDDAKSMMALLANSARVDLKQVVRQSVQRWVHVPAQATTFLQDLQTFVDQVNDIFNTTITLMSLPTEDEILDELLAAIEDHVDLPVLEVIYGLYVATASNPAQMLDRVEQIFTSVFEGKSLIDYVRDLMIPKVDCSLHVDLGVKFPPEILHPVELVDGHYVRADGNVTLTIGGIDFFYGTERGIGFDADLASGFNVQLAEIADTGFIIRVEQFKLDLSTTGTLPEVAADGRGPEFVGVYLKEAEIILPDFWQPVHDDPDPATWAKITARNVLVGTGGLSGAFTLEGNDEGFLKTRFGRPASPLEPEDAGFTLEVTKFDLRFHQGEITGSEIRGRLIIPGLKKKDYAPGDPDTTENGERIIEVEIKFDKGGFRVGGTFTGIELELKDVFTYTVTSLFVGQQDGRYYLETSGSLDIVATIPGVGGRFIEKPFEIDKLLVWSNGQFDFQGGSLVLPKISPLKVGPVDLSVTALHMGRDRQFYGGVERSYRFFGFDGGVKSGVGGVDARGEGIKFYFTVDDDPVQHLDPHRYLRIETIRVDLRIPADVPESQASLLLSGWVSMKDASSKTLPSGEPNRALTEYGGGVNFVLPQLHMGGGADLRMIPSISAFLVDAHLELATPILLGSTGLGIYGFRGLIGSNYVIDKTDPEQPWWEFYKQDPSGIGATKFDVDKGFSVGAGVSVATAVDSGKTFSSKLFFLLSLPKVFLLEGQAAILSERVGLDTTEDPPFYALLSIDPDSVQAAFGAHLKIPEGSGDILTLDATLEMAFFFGRSSAWYINVGRDQPVEKRIQATILKILKGWAYFMLSSQGIKAGAGVDWKFEQDCGVARVGLGASLEVGGRVSFHPLQFGGWIILQGFAELAVFGIKFRLSVKASLSGEAPQPFIIAGSFKLSISTPWPLPDIDISVSLSWHFNDTHDIGEAGLMSPPDFATLGPDPCQYTQEPRQPAKAVHMLTGETFPLNMVRHDYTLRSDPGQSSPIASPAIPGPPAGGPVAGDGEWVGAFDDFIIPIDCFIDFEFLKGVLPNMADADMAKIAPLQDGAVNSEFIPPQKGVSNRVQHTYTVESLAIRYWDDTQGAWLPFDVLTASTPLLDVVAQSNPDLYGTDHPAALDWARQQLTEKNVPVGFWQVNEARVYNKLRLLARTPFSQNPEGPFTAKGYVPKIFVCPPDDIPMTCVDWLDVDPGTTYAGTPEDVRSYTFHRNLRFRAIETESDVVTTANPYSFARSLHFPAGDRIELKFPEAVTKVALRMTTFAEKVVVSYFLGYPSTGDGARTSPTGGRIDQWEVSQAAPKPGEAVDDAWDRLRALPSFIRAFCTGTLVTADPSVTALESIMDKKFRKTNLYLRQIWHMDPPDTTADFCAKLREMAGVLVVGLGGKDTFPRPVKKNADLFYRDVKRFASQYRATRLAAGDTISAPPPEQNGFYETWLDLLSCVGKAYEHRADLPATIGDLLGGQIDPAMVDIYARLQREVAIRGLKINQPETIDDPFARIRMSAEVIAMLSLELDSTSIPQTLIDDLDVYLARLDPLVVRLRDALGDGGSSLCAATTASVIPNGPGDVSAIAAGRSCSRLAELESIVRLFCSDVAGPVQNGSTDPVLASIEALLDGFAATVADLHAYFGWGASSASGTFCQKLRAVLRPVAVAWSVYDTLPAGLRIGVKDFYESLVHYAAIYDEMTDDLRPDPDPVIDLFLTNWVETLTCLCTLCGKVSDFGDQSERDYFVSTIDPAIDGLYDAVTAQTSETDESLYGSAWQTDDERMLRTSVEFLTALTTGCDGTDAAMQSWLTTRAGLFAADYDDPGTGSGFLQGAVSAYIGVICGGGAMGDDCPIWVRPLECLDTLIARRGYLPKNIYDKIVQDFDGLLLEISNAVFNVYQDIPVWPAFNSQIENTWFEVRYILGHFYATCLTGAEPDGAVLAAAGTALSTFLDVYAELQQVIDDLPADQRIALCGSTRSSRAIRMKRLVESYRKLCNHPPTPSELQAVPLSGVVSAIRSGQEILDRLAAELGIESVPGDWALEDFTDAVAALTRLMVTACVEYDRIPMTLETQLNDFCDYLLSQVDACSGSTAASGACQIACDSLLGELFCLSTVYAYRPYLPEGVFTGTGNQSIADKLHAHLVEIAKRAFLWSDTLALTGMMNRPVDRCAKVRVIANYFITNALSYADVPALETLFDAHDDVRTLLAEGIPSAHAQYCPVPGSGPYDPLQKKEKIAAEALSSEVVYDDPSKPIDRIVIGTIGGCLQTSCDTLLHQVCWLTQVEDEYNDTLPDPEVVQAVNQAMLFGLTKMIQPVWRPNVRYAVQIRTAEMIDSDPGKTYTTYYTFGFQTAGPIGHYHARGSSAAPQLDCRYQMLAAADREGEFRYAKLKQYIDVARSYPNADGNIIGAKPLYYENARLRLFYNQDYVSTMYGQWDAYGDRPAIRSGLQIIIRDPSLASFQVMIDPQWWKDESPRKAKDHDLFRYMALNMGDCLEFDPVLMNEDPPVKHTTVPLGTSLAPRKLYTAFFNALFGEGAADPDSREVHRYVFQTSRYPDFQSHIESCLLDGPGGGKRAVSSFTVAATVARVAAAVHAGDPAGLDPAELLEYDWILGQYADRYDRIVDGALGLGKLQPPITTEFLGVFAEDDSRLLGVLVRSPEPFNDPRLPVVELEAGLRLTSLGTSARVIFSKDVTRAFFTSDDFQIPAGSMTFEFEYRLFNGDVYTRATRVRQETTGGDTRWIEEEVPPVTISITLSA